jgi:Holliday junction resolvasome RuvABC DNA-binding subunit
LAAATQETLMKIEGIGQKTADTLIEKAQAFVAHLEQERSRREAAEEKAGTAQPSEEAKLEVSDVFVDEGAESDQGDESSEASEERS